MEREKLRLENQMLLQSHQRRHLELNLSTPAKKNHFLKIEAVQLRFKRKMKQN
jgi:hypothetical protein